ncbi:MAG: hypothetical protein H0V09_06855, partial [Gemmatimonadetes bacterium]|nr:hypothetical protein [Gemmatimonadota bacterium]
AGVVREGERLWRCIEDKTDFQLEGYRLRFRMDEAVEGKLALKVQKHLR